MNNTLPSITVLSSHCPMLKIKKEKEIKTKINTSIEKFDEDIFHCGNITYILNI